MRADKTRLRFVSLTALPAAHVTPGDPERQTETEREPAAEGKPWAGTHPAPKVPPGLGRLNPEHPLSLAGLNGNVVILDFWTYGCINCTRNLPWLKRLGAEFPGKLVFIGVHSAKFTQGGQTENLRNTILRYELSYPVVNDNEFRVFGMWGARAWPTLVIIDPAGNIVGGRSGEGFYPVCKPIVESLVVEFELTGALDRSPPFRFVRSEETRYSNFITVALSSLRSLKATYGTPP